MHESGTRRGRVYCCCCNQIAKIKHEQTQYAATAKLIMQDMLKLLNKQLKAKQVKKFGGWMNVS